MTKQNTLRRRMSTPQLKTEFENTFRTEFARLSETGLPKAMCAQQALLLAHSLSKQSPPQLPLALPIPAAVVINFALVTSLINTARASTDYSALIRMIGTVFSTPTQIICNFSAGNSLMQCDDAVDTSTIDIDIDISEVESIYHDLLEHDCCANALSNAIDNLVVTLQSNFTTKDYESSNSMKPYLIILEYPGLQDPQSDVVVRKLLLAMNKLPNEPMAALAMWVKNHAGLERYKRYLVILRQYMTLAVYQGGVEDARLATRFLSLLYAISSHFPSISLHEFYNDALNIDYMLSRIGQRNEFQQWIQDQRGEKLRRLGGHAAGSAASYCSHAHVNKWLKSTAKSFISFPFLLSASTKASVLELDTALQMRRDMDQQVNEAIRSGQQHVMPYLVLRVRREHVVIDTLNSLMYYEEEGAYKKQLRVVFDEEEGVDAGGVRKEYYQLVTKQLFNPGYGMFKYYESSRLLWFNSDSLESEQEFELIGILLGIAIYNSIILDLRMPMAVYKKLKGERCSLQDLTDLQPDLAQGLQSLLSFQGDVAAVFQTSFQITYELFGEMRVIELKPGGSDLLVTNDNRQEYVDLYVSYVMEESVATQFRAFNRGFKKVCGGAALDLFEPAELELLICGNPVLDFSELRAGTQYDDGYSAASPAIAQFWTVVSEFEDAEKRQFLKFVSGSDRSPIEGLSALRFVISRNGNEDARLPSAHTCFNHLLLPEYSSLEVMRTKIRFAMDEAEGFGLR